MPGERCAGLARSACPLGMESRRPRAVDVDLVVVEKEDLRRWAAELGEDLVVDLTVGLQEPDLVGSEAVIEEHDLDRHRGTSTPYGPRIRIRRSKNQRCAAFPEDFALRLPIVDPVVGAGTESPSAVSRWARDSSRPLRFG